MPIVTRRRLGGTALLIAAAWLGRETLAWLLGKALDLVSDGSGNVTLSAFPWQNSLALLLAAFGGYLALWPIKKPVKLTQKERLYRLHGRANRIVDGVRFLRGLEWHRRTPQTVEQIIDLANDGLSVLLEFQAEGIPIPELQTTDATATCVGLHAYYSELLAFMRDGHVELVMARANAAADGAMREAREFQPTSFFIER